MRHLPLLAIVALAGCANADISLSQVTKRLTITPEVTDLGVVAVGETRNGSLRFDSLAGGDITIRNVTLQNIEGDSFSLTNEDPFTVPNDGFIAFPFVFLADEPGFHRALLTVISESAEPELTLTLRAFATDPNILTYPSVLDFGPLAPGQLNVLTLTIDNAGAIDLEITEWDLAPPFSSDINFPMVVDSGDVLQVPIHFNPTTTDTAEHILHFGAGDFADVPVVSLRGNACAIGSPALYDVDGDGFSICGGDCNDNDPAVLPGAIETINGLDDNCDGTIDENTDAYDDDGDGFTELEGDCHDGMDTVHQEATEILGNGIDDDCDGTIDHGTTDLDSDGISPTGGDCDDNDATIRPGAMELPDGIDQNCNGIVDEQTIKFDDDGDGYCEHHVSCTDTTSAPGDCDDTSANGLATHPGAVEVADWYDNNCDGQIDENTIHDDTDGDGFSELGGDCDDSDPSVSPSRPEVVGNGIDDNCDGTVE